ncbi:hypothetical protein [Desulfosporosinus sp. SB140]|uniref:hypothetical protein n=1 Tax=Desulfosporosinus paludis TaxID=3115649 RepID=UPI00388DB43D
MKTKIVSRDQNDWIGYTIMIPSGKRVYCGRYLHTLDKPFNPGPVKLDDKLNKIPNSGKLKRR